MKGSSARTIAGWLVVLVIGIVPIAFNRTVLDAFDLTKATFLWIAGSGIVVYVLGSTRRRDLTSSVLGVVSFLAVMSLASMASIRPWSSLFGQYQRYGGLITLVICVAIFIVITKEFDLTWRSRAEASLKFAACACASYVVLQALDLDPWSWSSPGQNKPLFGTMGNINTSAGLLGVTAPLFLGRLIVPRRQFERTIYALGFFLVGGAIGLNESFQGNAAGLVSFAVLLWAAAKASRPVQSLVFLLTALLFFAGGLLVNSVTDLAVYSIVALALGASFYFLPMGGEVGASWIRGSTQRLVAVVGSSISLVSALVLLFGDRVLDEIRGGMGERAAFYRSAFGLWLDRPLLGFGPETFGYLYSIHRPAWHAIEFEGNRPSSAHSVPLGILVSGGIVGFIAFLVLVGLILTKGVRAIRSRKGDDRWLTAATTGAFVAAFVQSWVSVEHVALLVVFFALGGLTIAAGRTEPGTTGRPKRQRTSSRDVAFVALIFLIPVLIAPQLSRPFRADLTARRGLEKAYEQNDLQGALDLVRHAAEIAPWDPQQQLRVVTVLQDLGDVKALAPEAERLSRMFNCLPSVTIGAAFAVGATGDFSKAAKIARCAISHDPNSVVVRRNVGELFAQMAEASFTNGKTDVAQQFVLDALELDPTNQRAGALRASLSASVG